MYKVFAVTTVTSNYINSVCTNTFAVTDMLHDSLPPTLFLCMVHQLGAAFPQNLDIVTKVYSGKQTDEMIRHVQSEYSSLSEFQGRNTGFNNLHKCQPGQEYKNSINLYYSVLLCFYIYYYKILEKFLQDLVRVLARTIHSALLILNATSSAWPHT